MTTVTLPREVVQQAIDAFGTCHLSTFEWNDTEQSFDAAKVQAAINALRAALDAPAKPVDCGVCKNYHAAQVCLITLNKTGPRECVDAKLFVPRANLGTKPIQLYTVTK